MNYDINLLRDTLCCPSKQQPIYELISKLPINELIVLRNELRGSSTNRLNQFLELAFKNKIGE